MYRDNSPLLCLTLPGSCLARFVQVFMLQNRRQGGWRVFAAGNVDPELALCLCSLPFLRLAATPSANEDEEAETLQGYPVISGRGCVTPYKMLRGSATSSFLYCGWMDIKRSSFAVGREAGTMRCRILYRVPLWVAFIMMCRRKGWDAVSMGTRSIGASKEREGTCL